MQKLKIHYKDPYGNVGSRTYEIRDTTEIVAICVMAEVTRFEIVDE